MMRRLLKNFVFIINLKRIKTSILFLSLIIFFASISVKTAISEDNLPINSVSLAKKVIENDIIGSPTLIVSDVNSIEPIVPLSYTSYLNRLRNFAFLEHLNKGTLMTIINSQQSRTDSHILFINSSFNDLPIWMAAIEARDISNKKPELSDQELVSVKLTEDGAAAFRVGSSGIYEIWMKNLSLPRDGIITNIEVNGKELENNIWKINGKGSWIKIGEMGLEKGKHKITVGDQNKERIKRLIQGLEIIIIYKEKLKEYQNIASQKSVSYLYYIDKKKIEDMLKDDGILEDIKSRNINPIRIGTQEFYVPKGGSYSIKAQLKKRMYLRESDFIIRISSSITTSADAIFNWKIKTLNTDYKQYNVEDGMRIDAYFQYQGNKEEAVILSKKFSDININEKRYIAISSELEHINVQEVELNIILTNPNNWFFKTKKLTLKIDRSPYVVNLHKIFKEKGFIKPGAEDKMLIRKVMVKFKKKDGIDAANSWKKKYSFIFKNFDFLKTEPMLFEIVNKFSDIYKNSSYYYFDTSGDLKGVDFLELIPSDIKDIYRLHIQRFVNLKDTPVLSLNFAKPEIDNAQQSGGMRNSFFKEWKVALVLDFDGDEKADKRIEILAPATGLVEGKLLLNINAYKEVKKRFPNEKNFNLLSIGISHPEGMPSLYQNVISKRLIKYREQIYKPSDYNKDAGVLKLDGKIYKIANGSWLKAKGDMDNWIEFSNVYLKKGEHSLDFLEGGKFKVEMVEIKPVNSEQLALNSAKPPEIEFSKINPTRYIVDVKGANGPFTFVLSESFHDEWKAYIRQKAIGEEPWSALWSAWSDRGNRFEIKDHFMVNGFANGWIVEPWQRAKGQVQRAEEEDFQIVLEFRPQRLFEIGLFISVITLSLCIGYLGYNWIRRRRF